MRDRVPIECSSTTSGDTPPVSGTEHDDFTRLVVPELEVLYRVARTLTHRSADAEDLVQDTLLRAFRSIDRFDGTHPRAWLLTIMRNAEVNRNRRRRPSLLYESESSDTEVDTATDGRPEEAWIGAEFERAVLVAVASLPDRSARVVELVDINGFSYGEAADILGIPLGTVMSRLHRARARIRKRLTDQGLAPPGGAQ